MIAKKSNPYFDTSKLPILSFVLSASKGGNNNCRNFTNTIIISFFILITKSSNKLKLWLIKYVNIETKMVNILDIKVEKNKTKAIRIINLKNMNISENIISKSIEIHVKNSIAKYKSDCKKVIRNITRENQKNFHKINSYLFIGFDRIKKIVFHSISLNNNWLPTNKTQTSQKISIIAIPKSTIILSPSHIVNFESEIEKIINKKANTSIRYKNLFLTISLNVFNAMFNIIYKLLIKL